MPNSRSAFLQGSDIKGLTVEGIVSIFVATPPEVPLPAASFHSHLPVSCRAGSEAELYTNVRMDVDQTPMTQPQNSVMLSKEYPRAGTSLEVLCRFFSLVLGASSRANQEVGAAGGVASHPPFGPLQTETKMKLRSWQWRCLDPSREYLYVHVRIHVYIYIHKHIAFPAPRTF